MTTPATYAPPVDALLRVGDKYLRSYHGKWANYPEIYGFTAEHIPELIQMAIDPDLNWADSESLEVWAPVHAWRTLGQLKAEAAIEPLLSTFNEMEESDWYREDMPDVFGLIGPAALVPVKDFLANPENEFYCRWSAASSLVKLGETYPEVRQDCVAALAERLEPFSRNSRDFNGMIISCLIDLRAQEAAPIIEQAFAAKWVDTSICGSWTDVQWELGLISQAEVYARRHHVDAERLKSKPAKPRSNSTKGFGAGISKKSQKNQAK
ncbi:HEAT repeat domain-containing protein [Egbenema bharatensis]|uniref:HEAT repeat domain-containing protein n=1 Tax=Egbenema bharatensis TaxID=3463334 RepID=UPI003A87DDF6